MQWSPQYQNVANFVSKWIPNTQHSPMTWFVNILADYHWLYWITDWNFSVAFCLQRPWSWSQDLGVTVSVFILKHKCEGLGLVLEISEKVLTTTLKSIQSVNVFPSSRSPTERCLLLHLQWMCRMTHECMPQQQAARQKYPPNDFCILAQSYQSLSWSQVALKYSTHIHRARCKS